jgi:hypothetical protein
MRCDVCSRRRSASLRIDPDQRTVPLRRLIQIKNERSHFSHYAMWTGEGRDGTRIRSASNDHRTDRVRPRSPFAHSSEWGPSRRPERSDRRQASSGHRHPGGATAHPFRIAAYRRTADSIRMLNDDIGAIADRGGREALEAVPRVGSALQSPAQSRSRPAGGASWST